MSSSEGRWVKSANNRPLAASTCWLVPPSPGFSAVRTLEKVSFGLIKRAETLFMVELILFHKSVLVISRFEPSIASFTVLFRFFMRSAETLLSATRAALCGNPWHHNPSCIIKRIRPEAAMSGFLMADPVISWIFFMSPSWVTSRIVLIIACFSFSQSSKASSHFARRCNSACESTSDADKGDDISANFRSVWLAICPMIFLVLSVVMYEVM